jgi:hypothetical protein
VKHEVDVNLRPTVSRPVRLGVEPLFGTDNQILISITFFLLHVRRPL